MSNEPLYTREQLETAFEFIRIANEQGGYIYSGVEKAGVPALNAIINNSYYYAHLPPPPRKVMMQMWRRFSGMLRALPEGDIMSNPDWVKVGEPFEFVFLDEAR